MDKTAEILFEYLKNILYYPEKAQLNIEELPEDFQKLGEGLAFLNDCVKEEREFAKAIARGELSVKSPNTNNILAMPIKEIQASLRHLVWQAKQVTKGDFSQRVDFMGEIADSFNEMTAQLSERSERLLKKRRLIEQQNQELESMLELMQSLTNYTHNMMFVFSKDSDELVFVNQSAEWFEKVYPKKAEKLQQCLLSHIMNEEAESDNWNTYIELETELEKLFYMIESFLIPWGEKQVVVHIVIDDTERTKKEQMIYNLAYLDPLTGLKNRRYAMDLMERWVKEGTEFLLSFIDVDYLKYCNDTYGHEAGDCYLISVAKALKILPGELCRVGGDEFIFLITGNDAEEREEQIFHIREFLKNQKITPYPRSFSYATKAVPAYPTEELETYIQEADRQMYQYKATHKKKLEDVLYEDDRT